MRVIIVGCGRLGNELANTLSLEGHDVTVIDKDEKALAKLPTSFKGTTIVGHGFDQAILHRAGIETADGFVSATGGDNTNIVTARIARDEFRVPKVVTRIHDPRRAQIYRRLGVPTVATTTWATNKIKDLLTYAPLDVQLSFGSGEVDLVRVTVPYLLAGKTADSITIPGEILVVAVTRLGKSFVPTLGTVFEEGDVIRVAVERTALGRLEELLGMR